MSFGKSYSSYYETPYEDLIARLRAETASLREENKRLQEDLAKATDLLMQGEALRDRLLYNSILAGAFDRKSKP